MYCSTCDAPLFRGKTVVVVGAGNSALEGVIDLFAYAEKIYLMVRSDTIRGDAVTREAVKKSEKVDIIYSAEITEILGDEVVTGVRYRDNKAHVDRELMLDGVFIEIGSVPNSEIVQGVVDMDQFGQILIDSKHGTTSHPGIFAAGDVTDDPYKQNNISAGDAVKAALAAYNYLLKRKKLTPAAG